VATTQRPRRPTTAAPKSPANSAITAKERARLIPSPARDHAPTARRYEARSLAIATRHVSEVAGEVTEASCRIDAFRHGGVDSTLAVRQPRAAASRSCMEVSAVATPRRRQASTVPTL
jgi:hypothetical protein